MRFEKGLGLRPTPECSAGITSAVLLSTTKSSWLVVPGWQVRQNGGREILSCYSRYVVEDAVIIGWIVGWIEIENFFNMRRECTLPRRWRSTPHPSMRDLTLYREHTRRNKIQCEYGMLSGLAPCWPNSPIGKAH